MRKSTAVPKNVVWHLTLIFGCLLAVALSGTGPFTLSFQTIAFVQCQ